MEKSIKIGEKLYLVTSDDSYLDEMGEEFEPNMVQLFKSLIKPDDVVADIGANIGMTAILFSSLAKNVYAFEPSPSTFEILKTNLSQVQADNVEAINLGLGERNEKLTITFAQNNRSGGFVSDKMNPGAGHVTEEIQIESLDNFFSQNVAPPNFIKIDVEGFEANVIKGGIETIKKNKPIVTLELNHFCLNVLRRTSVPDFFDYLRSVFPFLYAIDNDNATIVDLHNEEQSYVVMHQHLTRFRFPNIVGGFNSALAATLKDLEFAVNAKPDEQLVATPEVTDAAGRICVITPPPKSVKCDEIFSLDVEVSNDSTCVWGGYGDHPVFLSYHWYDKNGNAIVFDGSRSVLENRDVHPGQVVRATINVTAPSIAGDLRLIVTLVQEQVCWFEGRNFIPEEITVIVRPRANVAVILPAYNEELTIADTIEAFYNALPEAHIVVVNNNSRDNTATIARGTLERLNAYGKVIDECRQGKGNAVRRAFMEVNADIYVMADADLTYPAERVHDLIRPIFENKADMVVGDRFSGGHYQNENKRHFHGFGNNLVKWLINKLFRANLKDIMTGYRAFSHKFIKNYPILVEGFQIETDVTMHALDKHFRIMEVPIEYKDRPEGSFSKLSTFADGAKVLFTIAQVLRYYRPLIFFGWISGGFFLLGLLAGYPVIGDWLEYRYVYHIPLAVLAAGLEISAIMSMGIGLILDSITHQNKMAFERALIAEAYLKQNPKD